MLKFATLNYNIGVDNVINTVITGDETLLDADVVIANPQLFNKTWENIIRQGSDGVNRVYTPDSNQIRRAYEVRQNEIDTLCENGKVIIVFLAPVDTFLAQKSSSSGWSYVTNYDFLPINQTFLLENITRGRGGQENSIILKDNNNPLSQYYKAFKEELTYEAYLDINSEERNLNFLNNRSGKPIGFHLNVNNGLIVFLPPPNYQFENEKLIGVLSTCVQSIISGSKKSPPPNWIDGFNLRGEEEFEEQIQDSQKKIGELQKQLDSLNEKKNDISKFKGLLYEQGQVLENIVIEAFILMGFEAENRTVDDIEHDIVFSAKEGKGIAEVEGKDNDAIHIGKLDQLNRAVDEDFDLTDEYPQGVLIGNHYRFTKPENRSDPFTDKVLIVAVKKSFGLLTTLEIYKAVERILENPDDQEFKSKCRESILKTEGRLIKLGI